MNTSSDLGSRRISLAHLLDLKGAVLFVVIAQILDTLILCILEIVYVFRETNMGTAH